MANYAIAVVSYVDREQQREYLHDTVMPDLMEVDDGTYGVMGNHLLSLEKAYRFARKVGMEWVVILEDDAQPVLGFHPQLNAVLDVAPSPVVSLYNGTGHPAAYQRRFAEMAHREDVHFIMHKSLRHGVAYAVHAECFEAGLVDYMTKLAQQNWAPDDAISRWAQSQGRLIAYTNPSCVNHEDGPATQKSRRAFGMVTSMRRRPRKAHWVGTRLTWIDKQETI